MSTVEAVLAFLPVLTPGYFAEYTQAILTDVDPNEVEDLREELQAFLQVSVRISFCL